MKLGLAVLALPLLVPAQAKGIQWTAVYEDALSAAAESGRPVFIAVNMDGERANDLFAEKVYRDKEIVKLSEHTENLVASAFFHKKGTCPRFGCLTCGEHQKVDIRVREKVLKPDADGYVVAPQHVFLKPDGAVILSVPYQITRDELAWCFVTAITAVKPDAGVRMPQGAAPPKRLVMDGVSSLEDAAGGAGRSGPSPTTREDMERLIAEVKKGSLKGEERQSALRSIMRADEPEAVDFIVKELRAGGGRNAADPRVRQVNMVNQIGRLSPPRFFEVVEEFADSTDEGLRLACAATFEQLQAPQSLKVMNKALKKEKVGAIEGAWLRAMASSAPGDKKVRATVLKHARKNSDTDVRVAALVAAGYLSPDEDRDEVLATAFEDEVERVRQAAACGMAISRDRRWIEPLKAAAKDLPAGDHKACLTAAAAVLERGSLEALCGPLMKVCKDRIARERFFGRPGS